MNSWAGSASIVGFHFSIGLGLAIGFFSVQAQTVSTQAGVNTSVQAPAAGATWASLSKVQKSSLAPLEKYWDTLSVDQKKKWLAIGKTYPALGTAEQEKLHSRMLEWTALPATNRETARLNFAQSKAVARHDRAANWESYLALSTEEREKLAQGAKPKPTGAAVAVKPVAADKLTAVPVTRHTPEPVRAAVVAQSPINRSTLLPQLPSNPAVGAFSSTPAKP